MEQDPNAYFTGLLLRHQDELRIFIASMVRDWHSVDDILQETEMVLWGKIADYDPERSFGAWARGVAILEIRKHKARQYRMPALLTPEALAAIQAAWDVDEGEDPCLTTGDRMEALIRCVEKLEPSARKLLVLRYHENLSLAEIAQQVGRKVESVGKMFQRLRQALGDCARNQLAAEKDLP